MKLRQIAPVLMAAAVFSAAGLTQVNAQGGPGNGGRQGGPGGGGRGTGAAVMLCSTFNATDVVAQALGISATELRVALVSGKSVEDLATAKNVDIATIQTALDAARKAELDQALKDGLITQAQYDGIIQMAANRPAMGERMGRGGVRVPERNQVELAPVVANALGVTCADLVKEFISGKSVADVATAKSVDLKVVTDAITAAYKAALDADVKEGLITQAQADGQLNRLTAALPEALTQPGVLGRFGGRGDGPMDGRGPGGQDGKSDGNGRGPGRNNPNATPEVAATPAK